MKPTILQGVKNILSDWCWHGMNDLMHLGSSYRNRVSEWNEQLRDDRSDIRVASRREKGKATEEYKLARRIDCEKKVMRWGAKYEIIPGTPSSKPGLVLDHTQNRRGYHLQAISETLSKNRYIDRLEKNHHQGALF